MPSVPQPDPYTRQHNFSDFSENYPATPHNGAWLDDEFNELLNVIDEVIDRAALIQRDDGQIANLSIGLDQLKPEIVLGTPTDWVTATAYAAKAVVWEDDVLYVCNTAHTSGVFATDLAAAKWTAYLDYADPLGDAQDAATAAETAQAGAETAQTAAEAAQAAAEAAQAAAEAAQAAAEAATASIALPLAIAEGGHGATSAAQGLLNLGFSAFVNSLRSSANLAAYITALGGAAAVRSGLSLSTAALATIGTSGDTVPKNNTSNTFSDTQNVNKGSGGTSALQIGGTNDQTAQLSLLANSGQSRAVRFQTGATRRWIMDADAVAESGANGGSNFKLQAYDDAGNPIGTGLYILRSSLAATFAGVVLVPAGSAAAPAVAGSGDTNTGVEFPGSDQIYLCTGGSRRWGLSAAGELFANDANARLRAGAGSVAFPGSSFATETDCGHYVIGTNNIGFALNGALAVDYSTSRVQIAAAIDLQRGASPTALTTESVGYLGFGARQAKTLAFTFALADAGKMHELNSASSRIATIPTNASVAFPIDTAIPVENIGAGTLVLTPDSGVTLLNESGTSGAITLNQHHGGVLYKTATNTWRYRGNRA